MTANDAVMGYGQAGPDAVLAPAVATARRAGRQVTITLRGELDGVTVPEVLAALDDQLDAGVDSVVFDAAELEFMDSSGLRVLVLAGQRLGDMPGAVVVRNPSDVIRRLLEVTGLDDRFLEA